MTQSDGQAPVAAQTPAGSVTMWEVRATAGQGPALAHWARAAAPPHAQVYAGAEDRVVVIAPVPLALPDPPAQLVARPAQAWDFTPVPGPAPND